MENSSGYTSKKNKLLKSIRDMSLPDIEDEPFIFTDKPVVYKNLRGNIEGLNDGQSSMVENIVDYISGNLTIPFFMVQGSGGTGKSYSINRALESIPKGAVIAAAPSHFAKNVLKDFLGDAYTVTTIAGLLGKKITFNSDGEQILVPIRGLVPPITKFKVILIDEASMVDDETYEEILSYISKDKKLILLGDYCQLPPVNQTHDSLFFDNISAELTEPMRFTGPLYDICGFVRAEIIKIREGAIPSLNVLNIRTDRVSLINDSGSGYIFINNMATLLKSAIRRFKAGKGSDYARVVAYRNKTIQSVNRYIRKGLYGEDSKQFEFGELLINNGGYSIKKGRKTKQIISNGSVFEVESAINVFGPYNIPCVHLKFKDKRFEYPILVVATAGEREYEAILESLKKKAKDQSGLWRDYFNFKDSFAYFSYSYAVSSHKVQGSSIKHVYVLEDDIYSVRPIESKEKLQSLYVSLSRASFRAYIYNKNFKVFNSDLNIDNLKKDFDDV